MRRRLSDDGSLSPTRSDSNGSGSAWIDVREDSAVYGDIQLVLKEVFGEILRIASVDSRKMVKKSLWQAYDIEILINRQIFKRGKTKGRLPIGKITRAVLYSSFSKISFRK